jgi:hypothetical protein
VAKFAIAKQRHQDGITENQAILVNPNSPVEEICEV